MLNHVFEAWKNFSDWFFLVVMISNGIKQSCYPFLEHSKSDRLDCCLMKSIQFQGESNAQSAGTYGCAISALVSDWRQKWNSATGSNTDPLFPFGQVQVKPTIISSNDIQFYDSVNGP